MAQEEVVRLAVRVTPRSSRDQVAGYDAGVLRVRLTAPPVEGAANEALIAFLADALSLPRWRLSLIRGGRSRLKTVEVSGLSEAEIVRRLVPD